ncbi:hypothetical protein SKAU_G00171740 [Synaphobranchus kaupii]|uniref:Uncharacterized protein n=1 Tax=Synaphobranchus kaupii TaxID=118154 RepID=A0A9Q1FKJ0_SYNKA|nr:hypothetical protein SKAU_G00171740 [Synaphobranchus kaupii]
MPAEALRLLRIGPHCLIPRLLQQPGRMGPSMARGSQGLSCLLPPTSPDTQPGDGREEEEPALPGLLRRKWASASLRWPVPCHNKSPLRLSSNISGCSSSAASTLILAERSAALTHSSRRHAKTRQEKCPQRRSQENPNPNPPSGRGAACRSQPALRCAKANSQPRLPTILPQSLLTQSYRKEARRSFVNRREGKRRWFQAFWHVPSSRQTAREASDCVEQAPTELLFCVVEMSQTSSTNVSQRRMREALAPRGVRGSFNPSDGALQRKAGGRCLCSSWTSARGHTPTHVTQSNGINLKDVLEKL